MIEVLLELNFHSFLVNSIGEMSDLADQMPTRALRFSGEKFTSVRLLTDKTPGTDFEFLGSSIKREIKDEADREFDKQLLQYLTTHTAIDISRINIASGSSGYRTSPKSESSGEIGRIILTELPNQSRVDIELILKPGEFDAVWELTTKQKIRKVVATLICFKLKQGELDVNSEKILVAGVLSSSLQMMPD